MPDPPNVALKIAAGEITQEVLEEIETRLRTLRKQLETFQTPEFVAGFVAGTVLARAIEARLQQLDEILDRDVKRAGGLLHDLLGEIVLRPTPEGLVAELRGNIEGLLALEGALPAGITGYHGSGGRILQLPRRHELFA